MDNREAELPNKTDDNLNNFQKLSNNLIAGRQAKSMSLDDVVSATRISRYFIDALESGSFDRLPEEVLYEGLFEIWLNSMKSNLVILSHC